MVLSRVKVRLPEACTGKILNEFIVMAHTLKTMGDVLRSQIPLNRIGTPQDVAGTALYLSSTWSPLLVSQAV